MKGNSQTEHFMEKISSFSFTQVKKSKNETLDINYTHVEQQKLKFVQSYPYFYRAIFTSYLYR